jgi:thermitase
MRIHHAFGLTSAALVAAITLASCGGGGSSPRPVPTATPTLPPVGDACSSFSRRLGSVTRNNIHDSAGWVNPNRLYVTYRSSAASRAPQSIDRTVNAERVVDLGVQNGAGHRLINLGAGMNSTTAQATLRANPDVISVAPTHFRAISALPSTTNDPLAENVDQWYLFITNTAGAAATTAWATTHGSSAVSVAVIDTGIDESGTDPSDFIIDFQESVINGVRTTTPGAAQDTNGHGTNVAGLAAAQANNAYGFAGVGYSTHVQAYRIFPQTTAGSDCQTADTGDEAQAINDAVANGASVINLSLGAPQSAGVDAVEQAAVNVALAANVIVVAANGNEFPTTDGNQSDFPAAYAGVIGVGASAVTDNNSSNPSFSAITSEFVASYSNSGPALVAPGGDSSQDPASLATNPDVLHWIEGYSTTTDNFAPDQCRNGIVGGAPVCQVLFNGTSQATPQVSGAIALILATHGGSRALTPTRVKTILTSTADVLPGISATRQGAGRLNVGKAVVAP